MPVFQLRLGWWNAHLLKDTLVWTLGAGLVLLFSFPNAGKHEHFFRKTTLSTIKAGVWVAFYLNLVTFALPIEVVLQPVLLVLLLLSMVGRMKPETQGVATGISVVASVIVLAMAVGIGRRLLAGEASLDLQLTIQSFLLPVWMTVGALPAIFALSLYSNYQMAFNFIRMATPNSRVPWRARVALISGLRVHNREVERFARYGHWPRDLARATSLRDARAVIRAFRTSLRPL
jgi:hypothetical protein